MDSEPVNIKGTLTVIKSYDIYCGRCPASDAVDTVFTHRDAVSVVRERGWRWTLAHGWLCASCHAEFKKEHPPLDKFFLGTKGEE